MANVVPFRKNLAEQLEAVASLNDFDHVLADIRDQFGLDHVTYFWVQSPPGHRAKKPLLTTYPQDWVDHYFARNYSDRDPVLRVGRHTLLPFCWGDLRRETPSSKVFFDEAEDFGIGHNGLTVPIRGCNRETALLSVTAAQSAAAWLDFVEIHKADISIVAMMLHHAVVSNSAEHREPPVKALSRREIEVLEWAARGKTAWETAQILGLSEKTVYFYLRNAAAKLGVRSRMQAVAQASADHIIVP